MKIPPPGVESIWSENEKGAWVEMDFYWPERTRAGE